MLTPVSGTGQALPNAILAVLVPFATLFTNPTWRKAQVLLVGAILAPGQRTVAAALRVMGRSDHHDYARCCWWATTAMPCWTCSIAASPWPSRSP